MEDSVWQEIVRRWNSRRYTMKQIAFGMGLSVGQVSGRLRRAGLATKTRGDNAEAVAEAKAAVQEEFAEISRRRTQGLRVNGVVSQIRDVHSDDRYIETWEARKARRAREKQQAQG